MIRSLLATVLLCVAALGCEVDCIARCAPGAGVEFRKRDGTTLSGFSGWISLDGTTYDVVCPGSAKLRDDGVEWYTCGASGFPHFAVERIPERGYAAPLVFEITESGIGTVYSGNTTMVFDQEYVMCGGTCPRADDLSITVD